MLLPMLATPGTHVPTGDDWVHEVKWDGVRVMATVSTGSTTKDGGVRFTNRRGQDLAPRWPRPAGGPENLDLVVDGEVITLNDRGLPDFRVLTSGAPATYMVFDVLRYDGRDLTSLPLSERRVILEGLDLGGWQVPATYDDGLMLHAATRDQGLEGIVSKRIDSRYRPGERTPYWLKFPHRHRASYVVGGWRPQTGSTNRLGALLVGERTDAGLLYRGRVGSGIGPKQSRMLAELVAGLGRSSSPFADVVPKADAEGTQWLEPELVVDVETHGIGYERLRQPAFCGVRSDLT